VYYTFFISANYVDEVEVNVVSLDCSVSKTLHVYIKHGKYQIVFQNNNIQFVFPFSWKKYSSLQNQPPTIFSRMEKPHNLVWTIGLASWCMWMVGIVPTFSSVSLLDF
jgi:hypothetical protein